MSTAIAPLNRPTSTLDLDALKTGLHQDLQQVLEPLETWSGYTSADRGAVLEAFRATLSGGYGVIMDAVLNAALPASIAIRARAHVIDLIIEDLFEFTQRAVYPGFSPTTGEQIAIVATGGYGRGELAPHSDIDLMFLLPHKLAARTEQVCEYMLYLLWDLGLTVGHATRNTDEAIRLARDDLTIRTALLESRCVVGDRELFQGFRQRFDDEVVRDSALAFVEAKLAERDERHNRMGDTRYVLEPNVKEGKGGLRDLQTLF